MDILAGDKRGIACDQREINADTLYSYGDAEIYIGARGTSA